MAEVILKHITKTYDRINNVVHDLSLKIQDGEFVVLVGPSGCGKSTTLRMIAGLEEITGGELFIGAKKVNNLPPKDRDIAMVFQNYALYGHMTVFDNIAFGLKLRKVPKRDIRNRARAAAAVVGMEEYLERRPKALSGGQRQRVALARAIVRDPKVFLFDEPLSNLDAKLRVQMRLEIARLQRKLGTTTIYVTHDQTEAMTMADRIAVLKDGLLQQFDTPLQLYDYPANVFVAGFIGSPSMNFIPGTIDEAGNFEYASGIIRIPHANEHLKMQKGSNVILGVRPEDIRVTQPEGRGSVPDFEAEILNVEQMGNESLLYVKAGDYELVARIGTGHQLAMTGSISLYFHIENVHYFDPGSGERLSLIH